MKYIITESQYVKLNRVNIEHLKEPMFRYWDINGPENYKSTMKLFSIPPAGVTLVEDWLLQWMGGVEKVLKMLRKYEGKVMNANEGSYDFDFYLENVRMYIHGGVEIYYDAIADGDGKVEINQNGIEYDNIYDAHLDEDIGWEVDDEIKDTIRDVLEIEIPVEFTIIIDSIKITSPKKFNI